MSIKRRLQSGGVGCPVRTCCGHVADTQVLKCGRPHFLVKKKNFGFFEIYGVSHGQGGGGVESVQTFCGQRGRRSNIRDFVRTYFMGDP